MCIAGYQGRQVFWTRSTLSHSYKCSLLVYELDSESDSIRLVQTRRRIFGVEASIQQIDTLSSTTTEARVMERNYKPIMVMLVSERVHLFELGESKGPLAPKFSIPQVVKPVRMFAIRGSRIAMALQNPECLVIYTVSSSSITESSVSELCLFSRFQLDQKHEMSTLGAAGNILNILWIDSLRIMIALSSGFSILHLETGLMHSVLSFQHGLFSRLLPSSSTASTQRRPTMCLSPNTSEILLTKDGISKNLSNMSRQDLFFGFRGIFRATQPYPVEYSR